MAAVKEADDIEADADARAARAAAESAPPPPAKSKMQYREQFMKRRRGRLLLMVADTGRWPVASGRSAVGRARRHPVLRSPAPDDA